MRNGFLAGGAWLFALVALAATQGTGVFEIRQDRLGVGGKARQSDSYWLRDAVASLQPVGVTRSATYENRSGLIRLLADPEPGDLDENGVINAKDLFLFSLSWGTEAGQPGYYFPSDLVSAPDDLRINEEDLLELMRLYHVES